MATAGASTRGSVTTSADRAAPVRPGRRRTAWRPGSRVEPCSTWARWHGLHRVVRGQEPLLPPSLDELELLLTVVRGLVGSRAAGRRRCGRRRGRGGRPSCVETGAWPCSTVGRGRRAGRRCGWRRRRRRRTARRRRRRSRRSPPGCGWSGTELGGHAPSVPRLAVVELVGDACGRSCERWPAGSADPRPAALIRRAGRRTRRDASDRVTQRAHVGAVAQHLARHAGHDVGARRRRRCGARRRPCRPGRRCPAPGTARSAATARPPTTRSWPRRRRRTDPIGCCGAVARGQLVDHGLGHADARPRCARAGTAALPGWTSAPGRTRPPPCSAAAAKAGSSEPTPRYGLTVMASAASGDDGSR